MQTALLEHQSLHPVVVEYLGIYWCTPHATTGVALALLLHRRLLRTRLDIVGHPLSSFFKDPATELRQLCHRMKRKRESSKKHTDFHRAAKSLTLQLVTSSGCGNPLSLSKETLRLAVPAKCWSITDSFRLNDGTTWNASKLAKVSSGARSLHPEKTWKAQEASTPRFPSPGSPGLPAAREACQVAAAALSAPVATCAAIDPDMPELQAGAPLPAVVADRAAPDLDPPEPQPGLAPFCVLQPWARQPLKCYDWPPASAQMPRLSMGGGARLQPVEASRYQCRLCPYASKWRSNLVLHERVHTGERPFRCHLCSRAFASHSDMVRHLRTHTGERPFQCPLCPATFTQRGNARAHHLRLHGRSTPVARSDRLARSAFDRTNH
ncbi:uncharacterized protein [Dermacentor albipictus]|uniref:uncharacterized protein isoform X2 n=1 Tax=Dermacentor albipictus TaxID=60249 RepID=UPI0031FC690D